MFLGVIVLQTAVIKSGRLPDSMISAAFSRTENRSVQNSGIGRSAAAVRCYSILRYSYQSFGMRQIRLATCMLDQTNHVAPGARSAMCALDQTNHIAPGARSAMCAPDQTNQVNIYTRSLCREHKQCKF